MISLKNCENPKLASIFCNSVISRFLKASDIYYIYCLKTKLLHLLTYIFANDGHNKIHFE